MWLKAKRIDILLAAIKMTRLELAKELECNPKLLDRVFDGNAEAGEELSRLLVAAFGATEMQGIIDWRRTA